MLVVPALLAVSRPSGYGIIDSLLICWSKDHGEHAPGLRRPHHADAPVVCLASHRGAVAHLFPLIRDDVVAGDIRDIPGIPDEATDEEQRMCRTLRYT